MIQKIIKKFLLFLMFTLARKLCQCTCCFVLYSATSLGWLHGVKATNEQQKEPDYFKNKPFSKSSEYFWNAYKKLLQKTSYPKTVVRRCSLKHMCWSLFSNRPATFWKKRFRHSCFPMNFVKFLGTSCLQNTSG